MKKWAVPILCVILLFAGYRFFFSRPDVRNPVPSGENIICFGDSLTYGTGAKQGMDYPSQLSRMIAEPILNAGIPGDTTASALERLQEDVLSKSPRIVLITLGGNDLKNGVPKETAFENLRKIIRSIQDQGALVIVGGIEIPFWGKGFGEAYGALCEELGALLIPNIFEGIMGDRRLMSDRIHPNDAGYTIVAQKFYEEIKPYL
ncbi:MAG: arylesterase [Pseudomonadota bacterium]